jgi:hypothetical protein
MRIRFTVFLTLTLIVALVSSTVLQNRTNARVETKSNQIKPQVKRKPIQPDLPGTVSGATDPEAIPDTVAFELFMRSIADYPSESVFKDAGLRGNQINNALNYVQSFELAMSLFDRDARKIKGSRSGTDRLAQLQKKKEEYLERGMNHYLPMILGADGGNKIRSYINGQVKPRSKKVPVSDARKDRQDIKSKEAASYQSGDVLTARHHASLPLLPGAYVYCNAWYDGENVYGAGTVSSNYSDYNQYIVTTTVIAPGGGRYSTSQTGWDYAAVTDTEYLPIMPNDGTFSVESVVEGTDGYFASATATAQVPAQVRLSSVTMVPPTLLTVPGEAALVVRVGTTQSVNSGTAAFLEANEVTSGGISYSVNPPSRNISFLLQGEGKTDTKTFTFIVGTQQPPQGGKIDTTGARVKSCGNSFSASSLV